MNSLERQRDDILEKLRGIQRLRRGQVSEQMLKRKGADGKVREYGPYFVWQSTLKGEKRSQRIPADQVKEVRGDFEAYKHFQELCSQLASVLEKIACESGSKKNSTRRRRSSPRR